MSQGAALRPRGIAVGALTAALAVAAHGYGGGGVPSITDLALLLIAAGVVGAVVAETAWLTRGRLPLFAALASGQLFVHLILAAAAASGHAGQGHQATFTWAMLLAHLLAAAVCAALIDLIARLCGPLTALIRAAVSAASPRPGAEPHRLLPRQDAVPPRAGCDVALHSLSRRGPPVRA